MRQPRRVVEPQLSLHVGQLVLNRLWTAMHSAGHLLSTHSHRHPGNEDVLAGSQFPEMTRKTVGGVGGTGEVHDISLLKSLSSKLVAHTAVTAKKYVAPRTILETLPVVLVPTENELVYVALAGP